MAEDLRAETEEALLEAIKKEVSRGEAGSAGALRFAEAWAWVKRPDMPHGGSTAD